jgi:hypothetical protein
MTMKRAILLTGTVILSGIIMLSTQVAHAKKNKNYTVRSLKGCYVNSLLGTIVPDPTNPALQLPMTSIVRFCADGKGSAKVTATQNIGGSCIIEQTGIAEYSVDKSGIGLATATLENDVVSGSGCTYLAQPPTSGDIADFELRFGIQRDKCLQVIGTKLDPVEPMGDPVGMVLQGVACPQ